MSTESIFIIIFPIISGLFFVSFIVIAVISFSSLFLQHKILKQLAEKNGYGFWNGSIIGRYPESKIFYPEMYINACIIDKKSDIEVGISSRGFKYTTMLCPELDGLTLYIDSLKDGKDNMHYLERSIAGNNFVSYRVDYTKLEKIELEGDFNKFFDIYQARGRQINTLSVLAPDVMVKLIDFYEWCNVEVNEGRITMFDLGERGALRPSINLEHVKTQLQRAVEVKELLHKSGRTYE